jgi:hypothetical protein
VRKFQQDPTFNLIRRRRGPRMKYGWGCGEQLTGRNMRAHFTTCAKRSAASGDVERRRGTLKVKRGRPARDRGGDAVGVVAPCSPDATCVRTSPCARSGRQAPSTGTAEERTRKPSVDARRAADAMRLVGLRRTGCWPGRDEPFLSVVWRQVQDCKVLQSPSDITNR